LDSALAISIHLSDSDMLKIHYKQFLLLERTSDEEKLPRIGLE